MARRSWSMSRHSGRNPAGPSIRAEDNGRRSEPPTRHRGVSFDRPATPLGCVRMTEPTTRRVLVIGWDGADWRILDPLMEAGALPNLAALIGRGARAVLTSTIPTHSWAAWPSFLTGVDPVDHGVYDILENRRGSSQKPVSFTSIRERTFL